MLKEDYDYWYSFTHLFYGPNLPKEKGATGLEEQTLLRALAAQAEGLVLLGPERGFSTLTLASDRRGSTQYPHPRTP